MANVEIKIKRSEVGGSAPSTSDLAVGELAMNPTDGKLYTKTSGDSIVVIGEKNSTSVSEGLKINAADIFTNFVKDMEDHGRTALHTEAGFVDELESSNDMIDEANSTGYSYESTDDYYTNATNVAIDLRTKQWTGTNDTPEAPASSPRYVYLFVVDEHTSGTPQYAVTRNGTNFTNVTFDATWTFNGTKVARRAVVDMLGMSTGTDPRMKVTNSAGDDYKLHAVGLQTRS